MFLNLGGVANVTYVGADGELIAFDTGPGNGLLDDWMFARTGKPFDADGRLAAQRHAVGAASSSELLGASLFRAAAAEVARPQCLLGGSGSAPLSDADGAATLLQFSARSVAAALQHLPEPPRACFASGGGRHNAELMRRCATALRPIQARATRGARLRRRRDRGAGFRVPRRAAVERTAALLSADDGRCQHRFPAAG